MNKEYKSKYDIEAGVYVKESRFADENGKAMKYMSGKVQIPAGLEPGTYWVNVEKNRFKKDERHPDWRVTFSKADTSFAAKPAQMVPAMPEDVI